MHGYTPRGKVEGETGLGPSRFGIQNLPDWGQKVTAPGRTYGILSERSSAKWDWSLAYKRLHLSEHRPLCRMAVRNLHPCRPLDFGTAAKDYGAGNHPNAQAQCHTHGNCCKCTGLSNNTVSSLSARQLPHATNRTDKPRPPSQPW